MVATEVSEALARAAQAGPYFAVAAGRGSDIDSGWLPFRALLDDREVLAERVRYVRAAIASRAGLSPDDVEERACASIHFLGLASRVLAPAVGAGALSALVPDVGPDEISWRRVDGGPVPMSWASATGHPVTSAAQAAARLDSGMLSRVITPLVQTFATSFQLSRQVLWGNAASALAGAAGMLGHTGQRLQIDPVEIVHAAMRTGALAGTGGYRVTDAGAQVFVRDSCCLFYRIPGGGTCGDCVLDR